MDSQLVQTLATKRVKLTDVFRIGTCKACGTTMYVRYIRNSVNVFCTTELDARSTLRYTTTHLWRDAKQHLDGDLRHVGPRGMTKTLLQSAICAYLSAFQEDDRDNQDDDDDIDDEASSLVLGVGSEMGGARIVELSSEPSGQPATEKDEESFVVITPIAHHQLSTFTNLKELISWFIRKLGHAVANLIQQILGRERTTVLAFGVAVAFQTELWRLRRQLREHPHLADGVWFRLIELAEKHSMTGLLSLLRTYDFTWAQARKIGRVIAQGIVREEASSDVDALEDVETRSLGD